MRNRTEEINVRVYKTEKNTIRRKAKKKCGMNMSEYLEAWEPAQPGKKPAPGADAGVSEADDAPRYRRYELAARTLTRP